MTTALGCPHCGDTDYIGFEVRGVYDGVLYWVCSKCNYAWARFTDGRTRLTQLSREYADEHNHQQQQQTRSNP